MTEQEIKENNILIAEFMGVVFYDDNNQYYNSIEGCFVGLNLKYHASWNWLMSVVEKIENIDETTQVLFFPKGCIIENDLKCSVSIDCDTKIEAVYLACIAFIKWYNKNQRSL